MQMAYGSHFYTTFVGPLCISERTSYRPFVMQVRDSKGCTPLHGAVAEGHDSVVKQLMRAHADLSIVDNVSNCGVCLYGLVVWQTAWLNA